jgi:hypothetical protein
MWWYFVPIPLIILLHHRWAHRADAALSSCEKWFQCSDIANHETWVVVSMTILLTYAATSRWGCA